MARRRHQLDEEDEYLPDLPSTSRAVAWSALFFSAIALLVSLATLFLTWRGGALVENAVMLSSQVSQHWRHASAAKNAGANPSAQPKPTPAANEPAIAEETIETTTPNATPAMTASGAALPVNSAEAAKLQGIRDRLEDLEKRILGGDKEVPFRMEQLRRDMEGLSHYASEATTKWVTPALTRLRSAREQLQRNGPQAAAMLGVLAADLRNRLASFRQTNDAEANASPTPAIESALPEPAADASSPPDESISENAAAQTENAEAPPDNAPLERTALKPAGSRVTTVDFGQVFKRSPLRQPLRWTDA